MRNDAGTIGDDSAGSGESERFERLRRLARRAVWGTTLAMALVLGACLYLVVGDHALLAAMLTAQLPPGVTAAPSSSGIAWAAAVEAVPVALFVAALWEARRLFGLFGRRRVFDAAVPSTLVRLGHLALGSAIAGIGARTLLCLVMTAAAPPGHHILSIGIASGDIASAIVGALFFAFARVLDEAIHIADENRGFV